MKTRCVFSTPDVIAARAAMAAARQAGIDDSDIRWSPARISDWKESPII